MASTPLSISSSSTFIEGKSSRQSAVANVSKSVAVPTLPLPSVVSPNRTWRTTVNCRKLCRNVVAMATGEAPTEVAPTELTEELTKKIGEVWDKVDDKYAVSSLAVAAVIALWTSTGIISAIDRLPLVPGILELVGIGYTGWFVYRNLIFKPDRDALIEKIKGTYDKILGTSSK